jgi:hypothetical protein
MKLLNNLMSNTPEITSQEYILDADGKFHRRTTITTPIINADKLLSEIKDDGVLILQPYYQTVSTDGVDDGSTVEHPTRFLSYSTTPHLVNVVSKLEYFPFKGAHLEDTDEADTYRMFIPSSGGDIPDHVTKHGALKWEPYYLGFDMYTYVQYNFEQKTAGSMYIFLVRDNKAYFPDIPNVFEDGRLCAGNDYETNFNRRSMDSMLDLHKKNHTLLYKSPCNNDLRNFSSEKHFVMFDGTGQTKSPRSGFSSSPEYSRFFRPSTNMFINTFAERAKSNL